MVLEISHLWIGGAMMSVPLALLLGMLGYVMYLDKAVRIVIAGALGVAALVVGGSFIAFNGSPIEFEIDWFWVGVALISVPVSLLLGGIGIACCYDADTRRFVGVMAGLLAMLAMLGAGLVLTIPPRKTADPTCGAKGGCECNESKR